MKDKIKTLEEEESENKEAIKKYYFRVSMPSSVNHTYNVSYYEGKPRFYMNHKALETKKVLMQEFKAYAINNKCPKFKDAVVIVEMVFTNLRKGRDLNNLYKTLFDAMEEVGIIDNDANIIERPLYKVFDKNLKESFVELWVYEAKGVPSQKDIDEYFFWVNKPQILAVMKTKLSKRRGEDSD